MSRTKRGIATLSAALVSVVGAAAGPASADGDYGPDTCLQGWVWREAFPGDHVCVTVATRHRTQADNAAAASRRNPAGGPYGPDTCLQYWVWREAGPGDHVCVDILARHRAQWDNEAAADRRASLNLTIGRWHPTATCENGICTGTSTDDIPRIQITGDHFNAGQVDVRIVRTSDQRVLWSRTFENGDATFPWWVNADVIDCSFLPAAPQNAYVQAYDDVSTRWSAQIPVSTGCSVL